MSHFSFGPPSLARPQSAANRFGVDYRAVAARLGEPVVPIIDFHAHIGGIEASKLFAEVASTFGVTTVQSMVGLSAAKEIKDSLKSAGLWGYNPQTRRGINMHFIAFPNFRQESRRHAMTDGFLNDIQGFHDQHGAKMMKLWNAPRMRELFPGDEGKDVVEFDSEWRVRQAQLAESLGMMIMVHVADPDTWFATRYADRATYGTKADHYRALERMIDRFPKPWVAAHMGGWPEDLAFLDSLLSRHQNLYLDTSATKWILRELSAHPAGRVCDFLLKWQGRILFGSDIVTMDDQLAPKPAPKDGTKPANASPMADLADSPEAAFDLYASRYAALRTMFETDYTGESPIADPDLVMIQQPGATPMSAPQLRGLSLDRDLLRTLYSSAALNLAPWLGKTPA